MREVKTIHVTPALKSGAKFKIHGVFIKKITTYGNLIPYSMPKNPVKQPFTGLFVA
jgi:hypothetical protein